MENLLFINRSYIKWVVEVEQSRLQLNLKTVEIWQWKPEDYKQRNIIERYIYYIYKSTSEGTCSCQHAYFALAKFFTSSKSSTSFFLLYGEIKFCI